MIAERLPIYKKTSGRYIFIPHFKTTQLYTVEKHSNTNKCEQVEAFLHLIREHDEDDGPTFNFPAGYQ